jgi:peptidoglycan/LPS O-acetylase OafA/YrhL
MALVAPGQVALVLIVLATSQLVYAFYPYRRRPRRYLPVLVSCAVAVLLGQVWALAGLPAVQVGDANLLPALAFALLLQPLAGRIRIRSKMGEHPC